jgi:two-component system cell cycle sensor histidine kinase/response regulator CckA
MLPIRRYLLRELTVTFGAMLLVMLALAWVGLDRAIESQAPIQETELDLLSGADLRQVEQLRQAELSLLAGAGVLLLAFAVWRVRRLAKRFGDQLEALAGSALALGEGRIPVSAPSDVTEISALDEALRKAGAALRQEAELRGQLERSQRLETMGTLTGGIAHDVNNQLASIVGQINLSKEMLPEGHPGLRSLSKAEDAADRCARMIKTLLSFTHQVQPRFQSLDLNALIANTATLLDRILGGLIRIELRLTPDLPLIVGEPVQLEQILLNLAVNARDAMPKGGRLTLSTEPAGPRHVCLTVKDTGTGIPEAVRPRIFEPFFTTKEIGKGSGLGLAMAHSILEAHGGRIEVDSQVDVGTAFRIHLRVQEESTKAVEDHAPVSRAPQHFAGRRILVAEDDPNLRELLSDAFTQAQAEVATAQDGLIAWNLFQHSPFDLVISDQRMPECTGLELLGRIRAAGSNVPVILASGYGLEGLEGELTKDPRLRFFVKPFAIRSLFAAALELLDLDISPRIKSDR